MILLLILVLFIYMLALDSDRVPQAVKHALGLLTLAVFIVYVVRVLARMSFMWF